MYPRVVLSTIGSPDINTHEIFHSYEILYGHENELDLGNNGYFANKPGADDPNDFSKYALGNIRNKNPLMNVAFPPGSTFEDTWITEPAYRHMFIDFSLKSPRKARKTTTGQRIVVSGILKDDNTAEISDWYFLPPGEVDNETSGDFEVSVKDATGQVISQAKIASSFEAIAFGLDGSEKAYSVSHVPFVLVLPYSENASAISIQLNGQSLANVNANAKLISDAIKLVPSLGFSGDPEIQRSTLLSQAIVIEQKISTGRFTEAKDLIVGQLRPSVVSFLIDGYQKQNPFQLTKEEVLAVIDGVIARLINNALDTGPVANAGGNAVVSTGETYELNGSASHDPHNLPLTYSWIILSQPNGSSVQLIGPNTATPSFTPLLVGNYIFQLIVNNGESSSRPATVTVAAKLGVPNQQPVAKAGFDRTADHGDLVTLDGNQSFDPDGNPLSYIWSMISKPPGSKAELIDPTSATPKFYGDVVGNFIFSLRVFDGRLFSDPDRILIRVTGNNRRPVAVVNSDIALVGSGNVNLSGANSFDLDGDTLSYEWVLEQMPAGSSAQLANSAAAATSFHADKIGIYAARLTVHDGRLRSLPAYVKVRVSNVPNLPPIANAGPDQNVFVGGAVQLDGSSSSDSENQPLSYIWSIASAPVGSTAQLSNANIVNPTIIPNVAGDYVLSLTVNDGSLSSAQDFMTIHATLPGPDPGVIRLTKSGGQVSTHTTIQQAVNQSDEGSVIEVGSGTYAEDVRINTKQNLALRTIANAQIQALRILSSSNLTIDGFDVNAAGQDRHAVQFPADNPSQNVVLKNLKVHGADPDFHGVNVGENSESIQILDSEVYGNGLHGINFHLSTGSPHLVDNAQVHSNGRNGIRIPSGLQITLRNIDVFSNGKHGIAAPDTDEVKIIEEEERRFGKLVGNVLIEGSRIYANTVNGLALASAGTSVLRTSEIRNNFANGVILNRTAVDAATFLLETDNIHHNGSNGVRIATNHPVTLLTNTIQENGTDTQSNARWGISRKKSGGENPNTVTLTNNVITNNHGNVGNNKSLDLGNFDVLLDAGDSGNQTTANNEGPGVGGLVEKFKTIWNKYFQ